MIESVAEAAEPSWMRLHLEKAFSAPPARVFTAFVDSSELRRWWGPAGFTVTSLRFDPVEATDYRIGMKPPDGDVFHLTGTFRTVEATRRLAFTFVWEEPDPDDQETLVTLSFEPTDPGTRLTLDQGPFKTAPRWELHRDGWTETLERLARTLA
jgi:uncharacterized protein YndB with AHSA1/START domain